MDIITADFETYYDREYSLSKMTTEAYVRDSRFEPLILTLMVNDSEVFHATGDDIVKLLSEVKLDNKLFCAHNCAFDAAILSFRYGIKPKGLLDTLSMARPKHALDVGCSLAALATYYGLEEKGTEVVKALGKHASDFTPAEWQQYVEYCKKDTRICRELFKILSHGFPASELRLIDTTIRMYTEPVIMLDRGVLQAHYVDVLEKKKNLVSQLGLPDGTTEEEAKAMLMSNDKFADYLVSLGVDPPTKISQRTGREAYAFSKTDQAFKDLLESDDQRVVAAVEARLGVKTTIEETRTARLLDAETRGPLPLMLNYYGAHTGRYSGAEKLNVQNFPRGGALREALAMPKGWTMMSCDSSQIEARLNAYVAGQEDTLDQFRNKQDIYSEFGTQVFGYPVSKKTKHERHVGKCAVLGLGYGMGPPKFRSYAKISGIDLEEFEANRIVKIYRDIHFKITAMWRKCDNVLDDIMLGKRGEICHCVTYDSNGIRLPNGMYIRYPFLQRLPDGSRGFRYINNPRMAQRYKESLLSDEEPKIQWAFIHGAKVVENIVQALARIVVTDQMNVISKRYKPLFQVHDEIVIACPDDEVEEAAAFMTEVMSTSPTWAPDLPLDCECNYGKNFKECK